MEQNWYPCVGWWRKREQRTLTLFTFAFPGLVCFILEGKHWVFLLCFARCTYHSFRNTNGVYMVPVSVYKFTGNRHFEYFPFITQHNWYFASHSIWVAQTKSQSIGVTSYCFPGLKYKWLYMPRPEKGMPSALWCQLSMETSFWKSIVPAGSHSSVHSSAEVAFIPVHLASGSLGSLRQVLPCWSACPLGISVRLSIPLYVSTGPTWQPSPSWGPAASYAQSYLWI